MLTISKAGRENINDMCLLLEDFIIKGGERRKGLGRYFMEGIKDLARKRGYARITLLADKDNGPAREFYRSQGFQNSNMDCWRYILKLPVNLR